MAKKSNKIRLTKGDMVFTVCNYTLLILLSFLFLYPILYVLSASFSSPRAVESGQLVLLPIEPSLDGYAYIAQYKDVWSGYANTLFYTFVGTFCNLAVTMPCAYV